MRKPCLSDREREVLLLVAAGHTRKSIARRLIISPRTAQTHLANIMNELDAACAAHAVTLALLHGLITLDDLRQIA